MARLVVLVDRTRSSWYDCSKPFLEGVLEALSEASGAGGVYNIIRLYYFERDNIWPVSMGVEGGVEEVLSRIPEPEGRGSMPMCSLKRLLDQEPCFSWDKCTIIMASDYRTTVGMDRDAECAEKAAQRIRSALENDTVEKVVIAIMPCGAGGSREPLITFISGFGVEPYFGAGSIIGVSIPSQLEDKLIVRIVEGGGVSGEALRDIVRDEARSLIRDLIEE